MKIKTSEATPPQLNWLVAWCEGVIGRIELEHVNGVWSVSAPEYECMFEPSTCWSQGGPIIEQHGINVCIQRDEPHYAISPKRRWYAQMDTRVWTGYGPTPLTAAMRCFVASRLGDEVDVPDELA